MTRVRKRRALLACAVGCLAIGIYANASLAAEPRILWERCHSGAAIAQCDEPRGVAADPDSGDVYVVDSANHRVSVFSIWGVFLRSWGWGVVDGSAELQVCGPTASPPTATCEEGLRGGAAGQFADPRGITIDDAGNLYVYESKDCTGGVDCPSLHTFRVQKFDASGEFLLAFGKEVNRTAVEEREAQEGASEPITVTVEEENLCTAASGDICGPGTEGSGPGEFGAGPLNTIDPEGSFIAAGTGGMIEVGGQERIQFFDQEGKYERTIPLPGKVVRALAVDSGGRSYVVFSPPGSTAATQDSEPNVRILDASGSEICEATIDDPRALAIEAPSPPGSAERLYVASLEGNTAHFHRFDAICSGGEAPEDESFAFEPSGLATFDHTTGIAVTNGCGSDGTLYYANEGGSGDFLRAYYPPPDPATCPPPARPPTIEEQFAVSATNDSAIVRATINPHFWSDTSYYVQWGTEECAAAPQACQQAELFPGAVLSGEEDSGVKTAEVTIGGLEPDTTYHYRFVAQSSGGGPVYGVAPPGGDASADEGLDNTFHILPPPLPAKTDCPNQDRRVGSSFHLPGCRAYEMVSPVNKEGGEIEVLANSLGDPAGLFQTAASGDKMTYSSYRAFAKPQSSPYTSQYLAVRGTDSWSSTAISPPQEGPRLLDVQVLESSYKAFTDNLCSGWVMPGFESKPAPGSLSGYSNLLRRDNCPPGEGSWETATPTLPVRGDSLDALQPLETGEFLPSIQGFAQDGSHAVFRAAGRLTPESALCTSAEEAANSFECPRQVYDFHAGALSFVCVLPGGNPVAGNCSTGTGLELESKNTHNSVYHAVSADGSRIFWSASRDKSGPLYVRINGSKTFGVSPSEPAWFWTAAADGSKVIYSPTENSGELPLGKPNLVEATITPLGTKNKNIVANELVGFMGTSEDATKVYFASRQVLTAAANSVGSTAQSGMANLYLFDSVTDGYKFIGSLAPSDVSPETQGISSPISYVPLRRSSRVAPDGMVAAFSSVAPLTGADNHDVESGTPDTEVFIYEAGTDTLRCVSCSASGARPRGRQIERSGGLRGPWIASSIPGWTDQTHPSRALSDDGTHLFFESRSSLLESDRNTVMDIYEWEPGDSSAACVAKGAELYLAEEGGCLSLISSPEANEDAHFSDAGATGRDIFFRTTSSLVSKDSGLSDIYDAREGGGFVEPPPQPSCDPDSTASPCQQSPPNPPAEQAPSSAVFAGEGQPNRPHCPKGKVRRKGRCVKKRHSHRRHGQPRHHASEKRGSR